MRRLRAAAQPVDFPRVNNALACAQTRREGILSETACRDSDARDAHVVTGGVTNIATAPSRTQGPRLGAQRRRHLDCSDGKVAGHAVPHARTRIE
jgi:hypothetical protein